MLSRFARPATASHYASTVAKAMADKKATRDKNAGLPAEALA